MFGSSTPSSDKRNLSGTSILDTSLTESSQAKQPKLSDATESSAGIIAMLTEIRSRIDNFELNIENQIKSVLNKLDDVCLRVAAAEERASSQQLEVDNLSARVDELEKCNSELADSNAELHSKIRELETQVSRSSHAGTDWEPSGSSATKILLLGDSNSAGKLKFGDSKGTLGKALPGSGEFCASFANLPDPESNTFNGVSDVILAIGTNDLKLDESNPADLARAMSRYVNSVAVKHPAVQMFMPGVLPTSVNNNSNINCKIQEYNHYIRDLCTGNPRLNFIDNKVFSTTSGTLKPNLGKGPSDPLHLSEEGIKLYCSRLKYALRQRYHLPVGPRRRNVQSDNNSYAAAVGSRGGNRGSQRSRGGRGTARGAS